MISNEPGGTREPSSGNGVTYLPLYMGRRPWRSSINMTENETNTNMGAHSALKPTTESGAARGGDQSPFAAAERVKQALRDSLHKRAKAEPQASSHQQEGLTTAGQATRSVDARRKPKPPEPALPPEEPDKEMFNPEIEIIITEYQSLRRCSRAAAIEGLLIQLLRYQAIPRRASSPDVDPYFEDWMRNTSPPDTGIGFRQACGILNNIAPRIFREYVERGQVRTLDEDRYSFVDVMKLAGFVLNRRP
jgi:hypothetical protein